jgi:hypothetical protein
MQFKLFGVPTGICVHVFPESGLLSTVPFEPHTLNGTKDFRFAVVPLVICTQFNPAFVDFKIKPLSPVIQHFNMLPGRKYIELSLFVNPEFMADQLLPLFVERSIVPLSPTIIEISVSNATEFRFCVVPDATDVQVVQFIKGEVDVDFNIVPPLPTAILVKAGEFVHDIVTP